jgi:hypothetical protein
MTEVRVDNFFVILSLAFIAAIFAPLFSFFKIFNMSDINPGNGSSFLKSAGSLFCRLFTFFSSIAVGGVALFAWNLGLNANDIFFGLPLHKQISQIAWPSDLTGMRFYICFHIFEL